MFTIRHLPNDFSFDMTGNILSEVILIYRYVMELKYLIIDFVVFCFTEMY